ncbi:MAG: competence/damage-inducible protein A [bacterium]
MDAEIITIGDELITGHTIDTNGPFLARHLTDIGIAVKHSSSVGDSHEMIQEAIRHAWRRSKIIIVTGGLGPTDDDITKKAIVKVFRRNLIFHEEILDDLKSRFAQRGIDMPAINQNQALLPQGATFFRNDIGSALGICIAEEGRVFIALPGVPSEAEQIMVDEVVPYLRKLRNQRRLTVVKLRTTGIFESRLSELIGPQTKLPGGVKLAYLPSYGGVDLRIIADGDTAEEAAGRANELARELQAKCGKYIYGRDDDTLEGVVGQLLRDNDKTMAVAESCTAGQLGMLVTAASGSSDYFLGGMIAYANQVKIDKLAIPTEIIDKHGAVSEECALAMAQGCRQVFGSDYALSVTGIAGPTGGSDDKPVGTTWIGLASAHTDTARLFNFGKTRAINRARAAYAALEMLRREILDIK